MRSLLALGALAALGLRAAPAAALDADPSNYLALLLTLQPGDVLSLAPGDYPSGLPITDLNGTADAPIVIAGPPGGTAVFLGDPCCNTVEITNSSHVTVRGIRVDGLGLEGVFGVSAKGSSANTVHHITIEECLFLGQGGSQQTVAISTKTPTFGWIIRRNIIDGAGTGLYLGNSNYEEPFVGGLIEYNLVQATIGYNMQIKNQNPWPAHPALPAGDAKTIIRHNVFIKNDQPSPDGVRPNLFLGAPPPSGPGAGSSVEVYGNFFYHNGHDEGLLQATGRVSVHDNVFVDASDEALLLAPHDGFPLLRAHVYNNTFFSAARAIVVGGAAPEGVAVVGNLVFAQTGIDGAADTDQDNLIDTEAGAALYVNAPSTILGQMDFYPQQGPVQGTPLDLSLFGGDDRPLCDFNGSFKGDQTFRGAYAGEGENPGWALAAEIKAPVLGCGAGAGGGGGGVGPGDGGQSAAGGGGEGGNAGGGGGGANSPSPAGCGCTDAGDPSAEIPWALIAMGIVVTRARASRGGDRTARR